MGSKRYSCHGVCASPSSFSWFSVCCCCHLCHLYFYVFHIIIVNGFVVVEVGQDDTLPKTEANHKLDKKHTIIHKHNE